MAMFTSSSCGRDVAPALVNRDQKKGMGEIQVTSFQCGKCCDVPSFEEDPRRCEGLDLARAVST